MVSSSQVLKDLQRQWKAIIMNYDFLKDCDESTEIVICINEREQQMLLALIETAGWATRYYSDTQDIDADEVLVWRDNLALKLLEQCMSCSNVYLMVNQTNVLYVEMLYNRYDGTTTSVNENCPTTNFDGDGSDERRMALCMGLTAYVKSYIRAWLQNAMVVLSLGALGLFLFAVPVLGWVAVVLIGGLAFVTQEYYDALSNEDAAEVVICDWLAALEGVAINKANWGAALTALVYDGGTDEYLIWQILSSEISYDKQWVAFLDAIGNAWPIAESGIQNCPCDDCTTDWTQVFLDGEGGEEWWYVAPANPYGTYNATEDRFEGTNRVISGRTYDYWDNDWICDFDESTITRIKFWFEWNSTYVPPTIELASIAKNVPTPVVVLKRYPGTSPSSGSGTIDTGDLCQAISQIKCRSTAYHQDGVMTGYTRITRIEISGVGTNPFL